MSRSNIIIMISCKVKMMSILKITTQINFNKFDLTCCYSAIKNTFLKQINTFTIYSLSLLTKWDKTHDFFQILFNIDIFSECPVTEM